MKIVEMKPSNLEKLTSAFCFPWSTTSETTKKWERYSKEHQEGKRRVYLIEQGEKIAGYASLLFYSDYPHFKEEGIPEIQDLWISEKLRSRGLGRKLIGYLEEKARAQNYRCIGLGVGLYKDYGAAQKLYFQLGYVPDGRGVTYQYAPVLHEKKYPVDDDLILWLVKQIS